MAALQTYSPPENKIVHTTSADLSARTSTFKPVHLVQYDQKLPILAVSMYNNGIEYVTPTSASATLRVGKKNRMFVILNALGCSQDRKIIYFEVSQQMVAEWGNPPVTVEISVDGGIAGTSPISVIIDKNPVQEGDIESTTEFKQLNEYVSEAGESAAAAKKSETAADASARASASSALQSGNSANQSAQSARDSASSASASATSASQSATSAGQSASSATASQKSAEASSASATESSGYANQSKDSATASAASATASTNSANDSAQSATESENSANESAQSAAASASSASDSQTSAEASEASATRSATSASESAASATASQKSAKDSANSATASAASARDSAASASESAASAKASETSATNSQNSAKNSADSAASSLEYSNNSATSASESAASAKESLDSATNSANSANESAASAAASQKSAEAAAASATASQTSATASATSATASQNSADASASSASAAAESAKQAAASASEIEEWNKTAESYAHGQTGTRPGEDTDSAQYYYEQAKLVSQALQGALLPMGTIAFAALENQTKAAGYLYNISDAFTSTMSFKDGGGKQYGAGANVFWTSDGYWDVLAPSTVSGIKGSNETNFRVGSVNIAPENLGLKPRTTVVTLTAAGWSGTVAPFTQTVTNASILASDALLVSNLADGATEAVQKAYTKAYGIIASGTSVTAAGSAMFKVYKKPASDISVGLLQQGG